MEEIKSQAKNSTGGSSMGIGKIQIADEVIAIIAGTAALEIEGVVAAPNMTVGDFAEILGKKNLSKGVKVSINGSHVSLTLNILVKFGHQIQVVSQDVQARVKTAVETMTGLQVSDVNVTVSGVQVEKERPSKSE